MSDLRNDQSGRLSQDLQRKEINNKSRKVQNYQWENFSTREFSQREDFEWI